MEGETATIGGSQRAGGCGTSTVELGADKEASAADGTRPLQCAAQQGHLEVVKALAEMGADKEAPTADGFTPLHNAAWHGHVAVVTTLVELGADIDNLV
jgi:ankyrin repeat protein